MIKIPRSPDELQSFVFGIMCGIAIVIGSWALVSYSAGVKWEAAFTEVRPTAAERFGCKHTYINARGEDTGECN